MENELSEVNNVQENETIVENTEKNIIKVIDNKNNEINENIDQPVVIKPSTEISAKSNIVEIIQVTSSLGIIASIYDDSDDSDDSDETELRIVEEQITITDNDQNKNYRNNVQSPDTSSEDSDSSSDSSSTLSESDSDTNNSESRIASTKPRRSKTNKGKGEFDDLPPIEDLTISVPEVLCDPMGEVGWIVEQMVVVKPKPNKPTLNFDTILFIDKGKRSLGRIFDVFGPVTEAHYCVRFNNEEHIQKSNIKVGMTVYYCPNTPYTSLVFMRDLLKVKASDDVGEEELPEFSDDEEEKAYYAALRAKQVNNQTNGVNKNNPVLTKRFKIHHETGWKAKHPWNSDKKNQLNNPVNRLNNPNYNWPNNTQNLYPNQQLNSWPYQSGDYYNNPWMFNPVYNGWIPSSYGTECQPFYQPANISSNVNSTQQTSPSFAWSSNSTFPPTHQNVPWHVPPPPPPPPPPQPPSSEM